MPEKNSDSPSFLREDLALLVGRISDKANFGLATPLHVIAKILMGHGWFFDVSVMLDHNGMMCEVLCSGKWGRHATHLRSGRNYLYRYGHVTCKTGYNRPRRVSLKLLQFITCNADVPWLRY